MARRKRGDGRTLDEHLHAQWKPGESMSTAWQRRSRRGKDLPNWRLVRYADDFVVLTDGTEDHLLILREQIAHLLEPLGLRLSEAKTRVVHMSEGFDFLGFRIQRKTQERHQQVVRLHLHRRPAVPIGEGQDS